MSALVIILVLALVAAPFAWSLLTLRDSLAGVVETVEGPTRCRCCEYELAGLISSKADFSPDKRCPECGVQLIESNIWLASDPTKSYPSRSRTNVARVVAAIYLTLYFGNSLTTRGAFTSFTWGSGSTPCPGPIVSRIDWSWSTQTRWLGFWNDQKTIEGDRFNRYSKIYYRSLYVAVVLSDGRTTTMTMPRSYPSDPRGWLRADFIDADGTTSSIKDNPLRVELRTWLARNIADETEREQIVAAILQAKIKLLLFGDAGSVSNFGSAYFNANFTSDSSLTVRWGYALAFAATLLLTYPISRHAKNRERAQLTTSPPPPTP